MPDRVRVVMDASLGGFHAADSWCNPITGKGGLVKAGTGELTLAGDNRYLGGTRIEGGFLPVLATPSLRGRFATVKVLLEGFRAVPRYHSSGLSVRLIATS